MNDKYLKKDCFALIYKGKFAGVPIYECNALTHLDCANCKFYKPEEEYFKNLSMKGLYKYGK